MCACRREVAILVCACRREVASLQGAEARRQAAPADARISQRERVFQLEEMGALVADEARPGAARGGRRRRESDGPREELGEPLAIV